MHDIRAIRDDPEAYDANWARRGLGPQTPEILRLDAAARGAQTELQHLQAERNAKSKEIGRAKAAGGDAGALMDEVAALKARMGDLEEEERSKGAALQAVLEGLPNLLDPDVPDGTDEGDNKEVASYIPPPREGGSAADVPPPRRGGGQGGVTGGGEDPPQPPPCTHGGEMCPTFPPLGEGGVRGGSRDAAAPPPPVPTLAGGGELPTGPDHVEIGERLGLMDFAAAAKMSGARFVVLKGPLARLERALAALMLDMATAEHGYTEVSPPLLVSKKAMFGTGQLPKFNEDLFKIDVHTKLSDVLLGLDKVGWLIPTAEVPLTNLVRDDITAQEALPLRFTAATPCFRSEAGAAGKDTRGMLRQHQFMKVEMVSITTPESSAQEHERMRGCAENVLKRLNLPFRTVVLCAGDTGFGVRKTYDLEVWLPGQGRYREISSVSNCGDFQARRMNARCRPKGDKRTRFLHTLNGSGVAVGRALIAVLENGWDGEKVVLPEALIPYMGGATHIGP
jgi:seryl-tRNA synthetase